MIVLYATEFAPKFDVNVLNASLDFLNDLINNGLHSRYFQTNNLSIP